MSDKVAEGTIHNADNDLKRIANFARGIIALEEDVAKFGGLESAIAQAEQRLADAKATGEAQAAANAQADADHKAAIATRNAEAEQYAATCRADGARIVSDARERAQQILDKARADGDELKRQVEAALTEQRNELTAIAAELQDKQRELGDAAGHLAHLNGELAAGQRALDEHRSRHREFLASIGGLPAERSAAK